MGDKETVPSEQETVPLDPLMALLHMRHAFTSLQSSPEEREQAKRSILEIIHKHNMLPMYRVVTEAFSWPYEEARAAEMSSFITQRLESIENSLQDAKTHRGDLEVREALSAKCNFFASIGDFDRCLAANEECAKSTLAAGSRLDLTFQRIRMGICFGNNDVAAKGIQAAHQLLKDGDWERRNRLKVYEGLYYIYIRDFKKASAFLLDSLATFAATELIDYKTFALVTVLASLPSLTRSELKKQVIESPEIISARLGDVTSLAHHIDQCRYREIFPALERVCDGMMRLVFVSAHVNYFFREMRVLVFTQFLDSYRSVTLESMSGAFGVPLPVLDAMLGAFISNERIAGRIDRVTGTIRTYRGDATNFQYHRLLKSADLLLNRIQKLSRLVES